MKTVGRGNSEWNKGCPLSLLWILATQLEHSESKSEFAQFIPRHGITSKIIRHYRYPLREFVDPRLLTLPHTP